MRKENKFTFVLSLMFKYSYFKQGILAVCIPQCVEIEQLTNKATIIACSFLNLCLDFVRALTYVDWGFIINLFHIYIHINTAFYVTVLEK
jgi:hypothetical protein